METPKKPAPHNKQEAEEALSFDPATPPAPADVHAFARRAGDINARAATALLGKRVKQ
jgi:hypothetical protein